LFVSESDVLEWELLEQLNQFEVFNTRFLAQHSASMMSVYNSNDQNHKSNQDEENECQHKAAVH
jgi:hypothetical protein